MLYPPPHIYPPPPHIIWALSRTAGMLGRGRAGWSPRRADGTCFLSFRFLVFIFVLSLPVFFYLPADITCFLAFGSLVTLAPSPSSPICSFSLFPLVFNVFFLFSLPDALSLCVFQRLSFLSDVVTLQNAIENIFYREHVQI